ncbi:DUF3857 domain-containing protein [Pseudoduganella violaceinigra]|uniref:DUF3857 domain-containing protein n=1 Tax=Pseudoduganella violaceinigra TaxID=246602 RepID=UPI0004895A8D|nr:DUF3857 domain-containing protein [Pseudoduganella violaceinigra]
MFRLSPGLQAVRLALAAALCTAPFAVFPLSAQAQEPAAQQSAPQAERSFERGAPLPGWVERLASLPAPVKGETASMRFSDLQVYVDDSTSYYVRRAAIAHQPSGLEGLAQIPIDFQPDYQRLYLHKVAIHRGKEVIDKTASADIRFLQRERNLEQGIYDGSVTAQIVVSDLRVDDTLEYEYTVAGQNPVFGRHLVQDGHWDNAFPSAYRRITLNMPADRFVNYRLVGASAAKMPQQSAEYKDGRRIMRFEEKGLEPVLPEQFVPDDVEQVRWMQFSDFQDWAEVNEWALDLFGASTAPGVLDGPLRVARAAKTKEEQVARVLEYVQNEIRYLSVSMGENSHRPFPPAKVLERRYGDCKDKSLLAVSMLRALGVDASPVLVATTTHKGLSKVLPSPIVFNHAIVRVALNGKEYYLDPTRRGQYGKLDSMGQAHAGRQVLVVKPGTTDLSVIPEAGAPTLRNRRSEQFSAPVIDKPAELVQRSEMYGVAAEDMRVMLAAMSKQELRKAYEGIMTRRYAEAQLAGDPKIEDDRVNNALMVEVRYTVPNLFTEMRTGEGWSMSYIPSNMAEVFAPPGTSHRNYPLMVPAHPGSMEYDMVVRLPDAFNITPGQATREIDDNAFTLQRKIDVARNNVHVNFQLSTKADRVQPADMAQYVKNVQKFNEAASGAINAFKADMRGAGAAPAAASAQPALPAPAAKTQTEEERLAVMVTNTTRAISSAEANGRDPVPALCERATALAWLGRKEEALKDAARAVQLQPSSSTALRCRADVNFTLGRFKESEADYTKVIARGAEEAEVFLARGLASLYQDKLAPAQADFRYAMSHYEDRTEQARAALWLRIAGGKPAAAGEKTEADAAWLGEVGAMFDGKTDPEQVITRAMRNVTVGVDARLVETYFYVGRHMLASGQKIKAKTYFQRAVGKRLLDNPYHVAAQHELSRL